MRNRKELLILLFIVSAVIIGVVIYSISGDEESVLPEEEYAEVEYKDEYLEKDEEEEEEEYTDEVGEIEYERSTISMIEENGIYKVPIEINGIDMSFIYDSGASFISISLTEVKFLFKQNKLSDDDIIGSVSYLDANGNISEGTVINLRSVKIGNNILYDVKASVVHNDKAPLLLGQSALSKFGKVSVDYKKNEITFE